jgi:hypothetical protein
MAESSANKSKKSPRTQTKKTPRAGKKLVPTPIPQPPGISGGIKARLKPKKK